MSTISSYELFLEKIAELLASTLAYEETDFIKKFGERVKELSAKNKELIAIEAATKRKFCKHSGRCSQNSFRGFLHAFTAAYSVKYGVDIVQSIFGGRLTMKHAIDSLISKDTVRFAAFFGFFIGGYKGLNCILRKVREKEDRWNAFIAGGVASLAMLLDEKHRRTAVALYMLARALQCFWFALEKREVVPQLKHGDTLLMGICNIQIIYAFLCEPDTLAPSYYGWIANMADLQYFYGKKGGRTVRSCLKDIALGSSSSSSQLPEMLAKSREILQQASGASVNSHKFDFCALCHPQTTSCTIGALQSCRRTFPKALKMYLPLNIVMMLIWKNKLLLKDPTEFFRRLFLSASRSSTFIALFTSLCWLVPCYMRNMFGGERRFYYLLNGFVAGSSAIIEFPKSRRVELGMYCLPRALESIWKMMLKRGLVKPVPFGEVLLFSLSMGTMMTFYQNETDTIPKNYEGIMAQFFGTN